MDKYVKVEKVKEILESAQIIKMRRKTPAFRHGECQL